MNRKRRTGIGFKITVLVLSVLIVSTLLMGTAALWGLKFLKNISIENSRDLGTYAAEGSQQALEKMAGSQVKAIAVEKAAFIEEKFNQVTSCLEGIVRLAEDIYAQPESYPDREISPPVKGETSLAPQLLISQRLLEPAEEELSEIRKLGNLKDLLVQYNAGNDMVSSTYVATVSGWMIQADYISYSKYSPGKDVPDYYEAQERQWYTLAMEAEEGQISYTDVIYDIHEGSECMVCSLPIRRNGEIVAVAGIGSYLDAINKVVLNTTVGETGYAFLLNGNGKIMVSGAAEGETKADAGQNMDLRKSENTSLANAASLMVEGNSGLVRLMIDGRETCLAYAPLPKLGWSLATVIDMDEVIAPARESEQIILNLTRDTEKKQDRAIQHMLSLYLMSASASFVLVGILSMLSGRKLAKPIKKLTKEVRNLDGGSLDKRIEIHTKDELEDLGNAFNGMSEQLSVYIKNLKNVTAEKERIRTELFVASRIQADMLPCAKDNKPNPRQIKLYARMTPAKEVGGDFYDFFYTDPNHLAFVVADVSGKGVPASLFMVIAMTLLRSRIPYAPTLAQAVSEVNEALCANNGNGMFVTAWIGLLNLSDGRLEYVNAGHNQPLLFHDGSYEYLTELSGLVLGGMEDTRYRQLEIQMEPGDSLFLYTDGVTEANDGEQNLYGDQRLWQMVNKCVSLTPEEIISAVWKDVEVFQENTPQFDDITMMALHYTGFIQNTVCARLSKLRQVMEFTDQELLQRGIPSTALRSIRMAEDEVFSNICYYSGAKTVTVGCRVEQRKDCFWVSLYFEDDGSPFDPLKKKAPDVALPPDQRKAGGLGIYLVSQLMDEVRYEYIGKNRLTFYKKIPLQEKSKETG